jgi:hypothetical protein
LCNAANVAVHIGVKADDFNIKMAECQQNHVATHAFPVARQWQMRHDPSKQET